MNSRNGELTPGTILDSTAFEVESCKVMEFAKATGATDPVHTDVGAAHRAGFTTAPAPPPPTVVAGHHRDQKQFVKDLGLAIERIVVGSVEWEYARPLMVGDSLTGHRRVVSDTTREGKRGGLMRLVTLETAWVDADGDTALTQRETLIERGA